MPVTLTFHKLSEKAPRHGQRIVYLRHSQEMYEDVELQYCIVRYLWQEQDGTYARYNDGDVAEDGSNLLVLFGQSTTNGGSLWMDEDDFWKVVSGDHNV